MRFAMNGSVSTKDYMIKLEDIEKLKFAKRVDSYQTLRLERNKDSSIKSDSEYISTIRVIEPTLDVRVNLIAKFVEVDGEFYLPEIRYTVKGEFYDTSEILYLVGDIFSDVIPAGVDIEVELIAVHNLCYKSEGGEKNYE